MRVRWLGWAGVEIESQDATLVIDPVADAGAVFAPFGASASDVPLPKVVSAQENRAAAGLLTHLHRDHADAAALASALAAGAPVLEPQAAGGAPLENLALAQAEKELADAGLHRRRLGYWDSVSTPPFALTALPAVDGLGDPQLSWLVEADGVRLLHLGDTMYHGYWWRFVQRFGPFDIALLPVNGAVISFPHRQPASPLSVAMTPDQAAIAAKILGARVAVPIHAEGYELPGAYEPTPDAAEHFAKAAAERGVNVEIPRFGEEIRVEPPAEPDAV